MVGTGFTQEGLTLTYPTVDVLSEMSWRKGPILNLDKWFEEYSIRRYGRRNLFAVQAWKVLYPEVFNSPNSDTSNVLTRLPKFNMIDDIAYNKTAVVKGWHLIATAAEKDPDIVKQETFRFDLVDITRQFLANHATVIYNLVTKAYEDKNLAELMEHSKSFLELLDDLEKILKTDRHFMLGPWLEAAKKIGTDEEEKELLEFNARVQVSQYYENYKSLF